MSLPIAVNGANGGATTGSGGAFSGNSIAPVDHLVGPGHGKWNLKGPQPEPNADAEDMEATSA